MTTENHDLPLSAYLLMRLHQLGEPQDPVDLLVKTWQAYPHLFGLEGYRNQHPDARLLLLPSRVRREYLRKEDGKWTLTDAGRAAAADLQRGILPELSLEPTAEEMLAELYRGVPARRYDPWEEYAEKVREGYVTHASRWGFTIECGGGEHRFKPDGGLTARHYDYFSDEVSDDFERAELAKGVLENMLPNLSWQDFHAAWQILGQRQTARPDALEEEWLPALVEQIKFDSLAVLVREAARDYRERPKEPPPRPSDQKLTDRMFSELGLAPHVFRHVEAHDCWLIRYTRHDGVVEQSRLPDLEPLKFCAQALREAPRRLTWGKLGYNEAVFQAERQYKPDLPMNDESLRKSWDELRRLRDERAKAKEDGDELVAEELQIEIDRVCKEVRNHQIKEKKQGQPTITKARNSARQNRLRACDALKKAGLLDLAKHLNDSINVNADGVAYEPPGTPPFWVF